MIGKLTDDIINTFINEFKKEHNQEKLKTQVIDPTIMYVMDKVYPYIIVTTIIYVLTFILAITILFLLVYKK